MRSCNPGPSRDKAKTCKHTEGPLRLPRDAGTPEEEGGRGQGAGLPGEADVWRGLLPRKSKGGQAQEGTGHRGGGTGGRGRPGGHLEKGREGRRPAGRGPGVRQG